MTDIVATMRTEIVEGLFVTTTSRRQDPSGKYETIVLDMRKGELSYTTFDNWNEAERNHIKAVRRTIFRLACQFTPEHEFKALES